MTHKKCVRVDDDSNSVLASPFSFLLIKQKDICSSSYNTGFIDHGMLLLLYV